MTNRKVGRPSGYTQAIGDQICQYMIDGMSLRKACEQPGSPSKSIASFSPFAVSSFRICAFDIL